MQNIIQQKTDICLNASNLQTAAQHAANAYSKNSKRSYINDFKLVTTYFPNFVNENLQILTPLQPTDVAALLGFLIEKGYIDNAGKKQQYKPASLNRLLTTISAAHRQTNLDSPITKAVRAIVKGYGKTLVNGKDSYKQKQAKALKDTAIVKQINKDIFDLNTNRGLRDKAIILIGFTACLRRSEIVNIKLENLTFDKEGVLIFIKDAKTGDYTKYIPFATDSETCTVTALKQWIKAAGITKKDYVFCSIIKGDKINKNQQIAGETVRRVIQASFGSDYSGHSLRVGFAVSAKEKGASVNDIMRAGAWKSNVMVNHYTEQVTAKQKAIKIF